MKPDERERRNKFAKAIAIAMHTETKSKPFPSLLQSAEDERRLQLRDYEPEQAYGSAEDFKEHQRYGGTREDY